MTGIELIAAERKRQIEEEGFTIEHDTHQDCGELALAACYYALPASQSIYDKGFQATIIPEFFFPWNWSLKCAPRQKKKHVNASLK